MLDFGCATSGRLCTRVMDYGNIGMGSSIGNLSELSVIRTIPLACVACGLLNSITELYLWRLEVFSKGGSADAFSAR